MHSREEHKLDNPVWNALIETHQSFALTYGNLKCYHPEVCPFGGYAGNSNVRNGIQEYSKLIGDFFIVGEKPEYPNSLLLKRELVCLQMVLHQKLDLPTDQRIERLSVIHAKQLINLVTLVQPGYFKKRTSSLGDYYGIFKGGNLVAITGERMKMNNYTELSAIVTHPHHTGKGYAKQLIAHTANSIINQQKIPFLHVAEFNTAAINLYQKLGFTVRRKISFWNLVRA